VAEAQHLLGELDWKKAVEDVKESVSWLKSKGCERVGVLGFCMGGALALGAGASIRHVDASICFYGIPPFSLPICCHCRRPFLATAMRHEILVIIRTLVPCPLPLINSSHSGLHVPMTMHLTIWPRKCRVEQGTGGHVSHAKADAVPLWKQR
jgi:hypothetical protein